MICQSRRLAGRKSRRLIVFDYFLRFTLSLSFILGLLVFNHLLLAVLLNSLGYSKLQKMVSGLLI